MYCSPCAGPYFGLVQGDSSCRRSSPPWSMPTTMASKPRVRANASSVSSTPHSLAEGRGRVVEQVLRVVHVDHGVALVGRGLVGRRQVQPQRAFAAEAGHARRCASTCTPGPAVERAGRPWRSRTRRARRTRSPARRARGDASCQGSAKSGGRPDFARRKRLLRRRPVQPRRVPSPASPAPPGALDARGDAATVGCVQARRPPAARAGPAGRARSGRSRSARSPSRRRRPATPA